MSDLASNTEVPELPIERFGYAVTDTRFPLLLPGA